MNHIWSKFQVKIQWPLNFEVLGIDSLNNCHLGQLNGGLQFHGCFKIQIQLAIIFSSKVQIHWFKFWMKLLRSNFYSFYKFLKIPKIEWLVAIESSTANPFEINFLIISRKNLHNNIHLKAIVVLIHLINFSVHINNI